MSSSGRAAHPGPDELTRYLAGESGEAERERVQEHLATCPRCTGELLDLAPFVQATAEGPAEEADSETAAGWRAFSRDLTAGAGGGRESSAATSVEVGDETAAPSLPDPIPAPPIPAPTPRSRSAAATFAALAAGLLVALVGAGLWGFEEHREARRLEQRVARLSAPRTDVPVLYLDRTVRSGPETPSVPAEADLFLLMVTPPVGSAAEVADEPYGLELVDAEGRRVLRETGLRLSDYGTLRIALSRSTVAAGSYRVRVLRAGEIQAEYALEVLPPTQPAD